MPRKRSVFISYDYQNDRHWKNLLLAWDRNSQFDFFISDYSADLSINSRNADSIKSVLSRYIREAPTFLVIVGEFTVQSNWVRWEIAKAIELGRAVVAVKTARENVTPPELLGIGASWAQSFTFNAISKALTEAI